MYGAVACILFLPPGRNFEKHARYQSSGRRLVEHFQEHESTGRLGKALWQSDERPAVDTNVGISTRRAFPDSALEAANISGGGGQVGSLCVSIKRTFSFPCSHRFVGLEQEMHPAVLSQVC
jgi:hypothetical protein